MGVVESPWSSNSRGVRSRAPKSSQSLVQRSSRGPRPPNTMFSSTVIRASLSSALTATKLSPTQTLLASSTTASLHTSSGPRQSRIKWGHTHKPFYHVKKTNKAIDEPLTAANRAFVQEAMKDAYVPDFDDGRYAYKRLEEDSEVTSGPVASSLLKGNLKPWPRGSYGDLTNVTRSGVLARKIGVHPMWKSNGTQVMVTLLHVDDNHVIRYIPPEDFAKTTVQERRVALCGSWGPGWRPTEIHQRLLRPFHRLWGDAQKTHGPISGLGERSYPARDTHLRIALSARSIHRRQGKIISSRLPRRNETLGFQGWSS